MEMTKDLITKVSNEAFDRVVEARNKVRFEVLSALIKTVEFELTEVAKSNPFKDEYCVLIDEEDFEESVMFEHSFDLVKEPQHMTLLKGEVTLSQDFGCIRVDLKIND